MSQHSDKQLSFAFASELDESRSTLGGDSLTVEEQMREMREMMANLKANLECQMNATDKPNKWNVPKGKGLVLDDEGRIIIKAGEDDQLASVRAREPIGLHHKRQIGESKCHVCLCPTVYFELRQKPGNGLIWIGLELLLTAATEETTAPFSNANSHVGAWAGSVGMNSQGHVWIDGVEKRPFDWAELEAGEFLVLGCGLVPSADGFELFFTRNGQLLGLETLKVEDGQPQPSTVFPVVSLSTHGTIVEANFGDCPAKPFAYNPVDHETAKKIRQDLLVVKREKEQLELAFTQKVAHLEVEMDKGKEANEQIRKKFIDLEKKLLVAKQEMQVVKREKEQLEAEMNKEKEQIRKKFIDLEKKLLVVKQEKEQLELAFTQKVAHLEAEMDKGKEANEQIRKKLSELEKKLLVAKKEKEQLELVFTQKVAHLEAEMDKGKEANEQIRKKFIDLEKKECLKELGLTGIVQTRSWNILRIAVNQQRLVTSGNWKIVGLKANKTSEGRAHVHADRPFPLARASPEDNLLYYYEVTVTGMRGCVRIGLCGADFPFASSDTFVGNFAGSFAMNGDGNYWASGTNKSGLANGALANGDVVGCGLLVMSTERRLFFTRNGEIWVKPILLGADDAKTNLHPMVTAYEASTHVAFNFGADLAANPFKYDLSHLEGVDA